MNAGLGALLEPRHTAVVTMELQVGVVGAGSLFPALTEAVAEELVAEVARTITAVCLTSTVEDGVSCTVTI